MLSSQKCKKLTMDLCDSNMVIKICFDHFFDKIEIFYQSLAAWKSGQLTNLFVLNLKSSVFSSGVGHQLYPERVPSGPDNA